MSDRDALFQAVLHAPDDDAPRLVFADWLDENGEADRAEFIRGFVETIALRPDPFFARAADLYRRAPLRWVEFTAPATLGEWDWDAVGPLEGMEFPGPPPGPISARAGHELPRLRRLKAVGL